MNSFVEWSRRVLPAPPHLWQSELAASPVCDNRLIRIPTGFGKTLGVFGAWAFHRLERGDVTWPRRLIWCLPMRVLVEQTEAEVRSALGRLGLLWDGARGRAGKVGVHTLMGGADAGAWHLYPEECAVLIGTQDMLLSRSLNRGYAAPRARWPMEFGLLEQDALWVLDEVQLMDVGLATTAQLQAFRQHRPERAIRPCRSWWMSATLQPSWLETVDTEAMVKALPQTRIASSARSGRLWDDVEKPVTLAPLKIPKEWAAQIVEAVQSRGRGRLTLVVVNTVERAVSVEAELVQALKGDPAQSQIRLVHSRFRPAERQRWRDEFLRRDASLPDGGRIIVATQVVEAGVDLDASLLFTELAPWPSLVQRFGRAARGGGRAEVVVFDRDAIDDKQAAPYTQGELVAARAALEELSDVAPLYLERFEEALTPERLAQLYPYRPAHLLLAREWRDLFDTTPDLSGADLDISRFIRSGDERDVQVFWVPIDPKQSPDAKVQPTRNALCAVPFLRAADWLCGKGSQKLGNGKRAWVWDWLDGAWKTCRRADVTPGRLILVDAVSGGYDPERGWAPDSRAAVPTIVSPEPVPSQWAADSAQDAEELSAYPWKTVATHGAEVAQVVAQIAADSNLSERYGALLGLAARWHDYGKAHPAFQGSIRSGERPARRDLAKAPNDAWPRSQRYRFPEGNERRPGFRHELASALSLFAVLSRHQPEHSALLGPWMSTLAALGETPERRANVPPPSACESEILALSSGDFDLVAYLVASHHGKVRCGLHAAPDDQEYRDRDGHGLPIRGLREGDELPETILQQGAPPVPALRLTLEPAALGLSNRTGASWAERVANLLECHGGPTLAYLEACLRAADIRASQLDTPDPLILEEGAS